MVVFTEVMSCRLLWKIFGGSEQIPPHRMGKLVCYWWFQASAAK